MRIETAEDIAAQALNEVKNRITSAIVAHIEAEARDLHYNSAAHLAGYATSTVEAWRNEALVFIAWRDACWVKALELLADAETTGVMPTVDGVLAQLPEWGE